MLNFGGVNECPGPPVFFKSPFLKKENASNPTISLSGLYSLGLRGRFLIDRNPPRKHPKWQGSMKSISTMRGVLRPILSYLTGTFQQFWGKTSYFHLPPSDRRKIVHPAVERHPAGPRTEKPTRNRCIFLNRENLETPAAVKLGDFWIDPTYTEVFQQPGFCQWIPHGFPALRFC